MSSPKFSPGQRVAISQSGFPFTGQIICKVLRVLPAEGRALQYRVKGESEAFERVVAESALQALPSE